MVSSNGGWVIRNDVLVATSYLVVRRACRRRNCPPPWSGKWGTLALSAHYRSGTLPLMNIETKTRLNWLSSLLLASQAAVSFAASPPQTRLDSEMQPSWQLL